MQEIFNEDYYKSGQDEERKPEVSDEELLVENWDKPEKEMAATTTTTTAASMIDDNQSGEMYEKNKKNNSNVEEFLQSQRKTKKKKSKLRQAIEKQKPVFDPKEKTFEQYFDEYYKLDCEDIIGDMPVRFQYREVVPNDFGLTIEEILTAGDKELNSWCSLKKTSQYCTKNEEMNDVYLYKNKAKNMDKKRKILASVYLKDSDDDDEEEKKPIATTNNGNTSNTSTKKKQKKSKQSLKNNANLSTTVKNEIAVAAATTTNEQNPVPSSSSINKKKRKKKDNKQEQSSQLSKKKIKKT